jgi:FdhD protein
MMTGSIATSVWRITSQGQQNAERTLPIEAPIAIEYNGIGFAVMMATPQDFKDFAVGFTLSERIVSEANEITHIDPHETSMGWLLKIRIAQQCVEPMIERVRVRVSESSCGICGLENLEQVARPLPPVQRTFTVEPAAIFAALSTLSSHQPLNAATGGAHVAAFCNPSGVILMAREDVGRHCALDKLIGALARTGIAVDSGFILMSSRCSYELVEKTVLAGCPMLVTISTATSLAVERAKQAGLRLVMLARPDAVLEIC